MATATKRIIEKEVITTKVVEVEAGVTLELSPAEARTLAYLIAPVGGHPDTTARGYRNAIAEALREAGYDYDLKKLEAVLGTDYRSIWLTPESRGIVEESI